MDVKGLRVGNIVEHVLLDDNAIKRGDKLLWKIRKIKASEFYMIHENPELVKPVRLTKIWLETFGFTEYEESSIFTIRAGNYYDCRNQLKTKLLKIKITLADNWRVENFGNKMIYLQYVHELQNLYYVIMGIELISV